MRTPRRHRRSRGPSWWADAAGRRPYLSLESRPPRGVRRTLGTVSEPDGSVHGGGRRRRPAMVFQIIPLTGRRKSAISSRDPPGPRPGAARCSLGIYSLSISARNGGSWRDFRLRRRRANHPTFLVSRTLYTRSTTVCSRAGRGADDTAGTGSAARIARIFRYG
jgi:hypothetical protein